MLALRTMTGDAPKDDINDVTFFLEELDDVLHVSGFVPWKLALCRTLGL